MGALRRRLRFFRARRAFDEGLAEEMRLHLQLRAERLQRQGVEPDEALPAARRHFGNPSLLRDACRDLWTWRWLEEALQDLRFAVRLATRATGFTALATLTLALGIGAGTAIFSIVDAVLLRPLPYKDPGRLVAIWDQSVREKGLNKLFASYVDFEQWSAQAASFETIGAATWAGTIGRVLTGFGPAREVIAVPVTASFFPTLGVAAAMGRTFTSADEKAGCSVVLGHEFWRAALDANPGIVGRSLTLDARSCTVLGVMPRRFAFYPSAAQMWMLIDADYQPGPNRLIVGVFARLKKGVTPEQAQSEVTAMHAALHRADGRERDIAPIVLPLQGEFTWLASRKLRSTLWVLSGAVILLVLIACVNLATLLLGRSRTRERELAVRAALGSGRTRLVRQVLMESLLLSIAGSTLGLLLAFSAIRYFRVLNPVELPVGADVVINLPVLGFIAALAVATTLIFGLLPAIRASRVDLAEALKVAGRGSWHAGPDRRFAQALIVSEVALSVVLLIGAGLLMNTLLRMHFEALGFDPNHVLTANVRLPARDADPSRRIAVYESLLERIREIPGVSQAAFTSWLPPYGGGNEAIEIDGRATPRGAAIHDVASQAITPAYFDVLHTPLLRGRKFNESDSAQSQPVAIVNRALARKYFPGAETLGHRVRLVGAQNATPWMTIVGVAGNEKYVTLLEETWAESPTLYRPLAQDPRPSMSIAVRASGGESTTAEAIQSSITSADANLVVNEVRNLRTQVAKPLAYPRFRAVVLGSFAGCALLLALVGVYGVLVQFVARRTQEFGVRMTLGALPADVFKLVLRQGGAPVLLGLVAGVLSALALGRLLSGLLYGVRPADPLTVGGVCLLLLAAASIALALPATRAAGVDPIAALRQE